MGISVTGINTEKIKVGILGCTGAVGQKLISLLEGHPFFEITEIAASENSAGKLYKEAVSWREANPIPQSVENLTVKKCLPDFDCKILFSGLDSNVAGGIEETMAKAGYIVVSNSKNHRMYDDVPLIIPEVNAAHFKLIEQQKKRWKSDGFIVTNPNCSTIVLAIALSPIYNLFGLSKVLVTTMQAVSGAGYPGVSSMDIMGNILPYIKDEEEKIQTETLKILGSYGKDKVQKVNYADFKISAACNRVPVRDGHTLSVSLETQKKVTREEIIPAFSSFNNSNRLNLNFAPDNIIDYIDEPGRPQPLLDLSKNNGMTISIGNLRKCNVLDWKFTALGHNTIRGAAGAAILNAEWLVENNYLEHEQNAKGEAEE